MSPLTSMFVCPACRLQCLASLWRSFGLELCPQAPRVMAVDGSVWGRYPADQSLQNSADLTSTMYLSLPRR
ncbi:hypothetical protein FN846DRAFT_948601 [Sphaerosporella brunnea]|uniref:Uncharacterized protein n=1 Tax=Sphaerosporella brunnea TaxID=1250544 RepID=A0A5J5EX34_9PEZI|nr:hypothetical protein FN846DRAFT_948601 [Sphaerosporella brunnea]